jgi:hypothetical protein
VNNAPLIRLETSGFDRTAWQAAAAPFLDKCLMQDWAFGEAKAATGLWRAERGIFLRGTEVVGAVQAMLRYLPLIGGGLVWINRGPLWRKTPEESPDRLAQILGILRDRWSAGGYYLRVAPPIEGAFAIADFTPTRTPGWASARVDLSQSPENLRANLQQKWRNALNKAERSELKLSSGDGAFDAFLDGYSGFITEKKFPTSVTPDFIVQLQLSLSAENKMTAHIAHAGNTLAGGTLIARYGDTAEYLAGFAAEASHGMNVGQILLWRAMISAKDSGLRWFDAGGMDEKRTPEGIYRFKAGLGGTPYRLADEIESCPTDLRARLVRWRVRRAMEGGNP